MNFNHNIISLFNETKVKSIVPFFLQKHEYDTTPKKKMNYKHNVNESPYIARLMLIGCTSIFSTFIRTELLRV